MTIFCKAPTKEIYGHGSTPEEAYKDFKNEWYASTPSGHPPGVEACDFFTLKPVEVVQEITMVPQTKMVVRS